MMPTHDETHMRRAIELARRGEGCVEPNPMVGCVIAHGEIPIAEGWHELFGEAHAEVNAIAKAGERTNGATAYVSLEPCSHHGKTPPCSQALVVAGLTRVVIAMSDPYPQVAGNGIDQLREAGIDVTIGVLEDKARALNAPYLKLVQEKRPWVIAKWAMTLDGRIATRTGSSQWISGEASRATTHGLRGRVDGILIGRGTAQIDNPLLTARSPNDQPRPPRIATRIIVDSQASLALESQLVATAQNSPVLIAASSHAPADNVARLRDAGCEVLLCEGEDHAQRLRFLLEELGRRRMTNILVEGGGQLLGSLFDANEIDEAHVFIAPKIIGGQSALPPIAGGGIAEMASAMQLSDPHYEQLGGDIYMYGRICESKRPWPEVQD